MYRRIVELVVFSVVLLAPFALQLELESDAGTVAKVNVPLADPLLALVGLPLLALAARALWRGRPGVLPGDLALFSCVVALSLLASEGAPSQAVDGLQMLDAFLLWPLIVLTALQRGSRRRVFAGAAALALVSLVAVACVQVLRDDPWYLVRGPFRDRSSFVAAVFVLAPPSLALLAAGSRAAFALGLGILGACALCLGTPLAVGALLGLVLVFALVAGADLGRLRSAAAVLLVLVVGSLGIGEAGWRRSEFRVEPHERRLEVRHARAAFDAGVPDADLGLGRYHVFVGSNFSHGLSPPPPPWIGEDPATESIVPVESLAEMAAALRRVHVRPLLGRGPGGGLDLARESFGPEPRSTTALPGNHGGFSLLALDLGLVGLAAFLLHVLCAARRCGRLARTEALPADRALSAGALAGVVGGCLALAGTPVVHLPVALYLVLVGLIGSGVVRSVSDA